MAQMQRMTVMQVLPGMEAGGVERGTLEVSEALSGRGHRSLVVSSGGRLVASLASHGAEHFTLPVHRKSPVALMQVRALRRLVREHGVQVLHARSRVPAWIAYLAWRGLRRQDRPAFVTTVHGLYSVNAYSRIMTRGQRVEVVSETVRRYVLDNYPGTDPGRLVLNHRGVDPDRFPFGYRPDDAWLEAWGRRFPELAGRFVITLAGRITRLKGHHDLIDAIAALRQRGVEAHGLIVGDQDPRRLAYARELRETVRRRGMAGHVTFTGHRSDVREVMAVSDAVVSLSSRPESFGRSVLEALRLGRPVVGYDHGGVGEVLEVMFPAGRVPLGDGAALVQRLADIATGDVERPAPCDRLLLSEMLERTLAMYREVVAPVSGRRRR